MTLTSGIRSLFMAELHTDLHRSNAQLSKIHFASFRWHIGSECDWN